MIEKGKDLTELFEVILLEGNIARNITGLPYKLWIDPFGVNRNIPHDKRRIKVIDPNNSSNRVPIKIHPTNPEIAAGSFKNKNTDITPVFEFIKKYYDDLMNIFDGTITIDEFKEKLKNEQI